jgi:hypothetical protein
VSRQHIPPRIARRDGRAQSRDAAADHQHIRHLLRQTRDFERKEVTTLGEGFEHASYSVLNLP